MLLKILKYRSPSLYLLFSRVHILRIKYFCDFHTCSRLFECDIYDTSGIEEILFHLAECIAHTLHRCDFCVLGSEIESETPITGFHTSREYSSYFRCFSPSPRTMPSSTIGESPVDDVFWIPHSIPDGGEWSAYSYKDSESSHKKKSEGL